MSKSLHRSLEAKLAALDGPEWDSSDDEENVQLISQVKDTKKKKKGKNSSNKSTAAPTKAKKGSKGTGVANKAKSSSVIYLGHLPPGFEDGEIRGFLTQFGSIRKLRLSRSKKTGNSRGYAFVEFVDPEVAEIVADTMSGYFLLEKRLVCHVMPRDKCHPSLFDGHNKKFVKVDWQGINREQVNKPRTAEGMKKITKRLVKRETAKRKKLEALGIDYDFPGYQDGDGEAEDDKATSGKRKRKSSKDEGAEAGNPKRRERKGSEVSTDGESSVKKSAKKKSAKKQRKTSDAESDPTAEEAVTPEKKSSSSRSAKTEIKKKQKKKSIKKRRDSVP